MGIPDDRALPVLQDGQITADDGPVLLLLGEIRLQGVEWFMTPQQLSLLSFLVCVGPANRRTIVEALWAGQRISDHRVSNLLAEFRAIVGRRHFPDPVGGRYNVLGIDTDLHRFQRGITSIRALGVQRPEMNDSTAALVEAASLRVLAAIDGVPFTTGSARYWSWLDDCSGLISAAEEQVAAGALAMADLLLNSGRVEAAMLALERGLRACPLDEELVVALVPLYKRQGKLRHAQRLVNGWEARIRRLGCGEPSARPRNRLAGPQARSIGSAVTTRLPL